MGEKLRDLQGGDQPGHCHDHRGEDSGGGAGVTIIFLYKTEYLQRSQDDRERSEQCGDWAVRGGSGAAGGGAEKLTDIIN